MTEPVAYYRENSNGIRIYYDKEMLPELDNNDIKVKPLYDKNSLHPRVKMTQSEFDEFKKLLSVGISTIYEAFDVIDSDRGEMDEFEQLYNRLFTNGVNAQAQSQIEFSKLWDSLSTSSPEETIEIVPDMKWFVRSKQLQNNGFYSYLEVGDYVTPTYDELRLKFATQFDTKEEAELWTNPLTEAVQLLVEGE